MPGKWDTSLKRLVGENPRQFIQWLIPTARFKGKVTSRPTNLNTGEIEADNLYEIWLNSKRCLVHLEFQSYYDKLMARRMWEYNALSTFLYKRPTYSFVIYLKKCKVPEAVYTWTFPTGEEVHHFTFKVIKVWEIPPEVIKQTGLVGLFPLMVLALGGKRPEVVEDIITSIEALGGKSAPELLSLTYIISSLVFKKEADRKWLKRRFRMLQDILRKTWAYQEIMQEGREEGLQKGLMEGRQEGLKDQRQMLLTFIQAHFPNITILAQKQANIINEPEELQSLALKLFAVQNEEQATQILLAVTQGNKQK